MDVVLAVWEKILKIVWWLWSWLYLWSFGHPVKISRSYIKPLTWLYLCGQKSGYELLRIVIKLDSGLDLNIQIE
jgi:hypothetical protein